MTFYILLITSLNDNFVLQITLIKDIICYSLSYQSYYILFIELSKILNITAIKDIKYYRLQSPMTLYITDY